MTSLFRFTVLFLLVVCGLEASAFSHTMLRLFQREEMVAGSYTAFCKDKEGFVWIGTDVGLLRFDGNHTDVFRYDELNDNSISDNRILTLFCDRDGGLWVGTVDGLNYFDRHTYTFRRIKLPNFELNGFIADMTQLDDGRIFFVVAGVGYFSVTKSPDGAEFKVEREYQGAVGERETGSMLNLGQDGMMLVSQSGKVFKMARYGDVEVACETASIPTRILRENENNVIIASKFEVYRYNTESGALTKLNIDGGRNIHILDACSTGKGLTYIGTSGAGLWEVKEGSDVVEQSQRLYSSSLEVDKLKIGCVFEDEAGNLWLGCNHKGIGIGPAKQMPFMSKKLGRINDEIDGEIICMDIVGDHIVAGLTSGKLLMMDIDGNFERLIKVPGGYTVTSVTGESGNTAVFGIVKDGIYRLNLDNGVVTKITDIERPYAGVILDVADNGDIVAAVSAAGVFKYDHVTGQKEWFRSAPGSSTLNGLYYAGIQNTSDGRIWIGGYGGLSCYDQEKQELVSLDQSPFVNRTVYDVCDGPNGCVLLATSRGLLKYRLGKGIERAYTMADGLPDSDVRTVSMDPKGGIWVGGMNGLSYLAPGSEKFQTFSSSLGVTEKAYFYSGLYLMGRRMVLGGYEGISVFSPDSVPDAVFVGDIKISGLYINGSRVTPNTTVDGKTPIIEGNETFPEVLHLNYKDKALVINLSTMDFRNNSHVRYEWQFSGDGDIWNSTPLGDSHVYVPSLDPGVYTLRMRGWDDNVCSEIRELKLDIAKPWYQSNMVYATLMLLVLSIIGLFYKVVKSRKEEEMNEAKIKLFMDISHEIRSPIMLLLNPVDALLKQQQSPEATTQLLTVRRNAQRVLGLADQLLDIQKMESGKMRLVYTKTDICAFVGELVEMFQAQAKSKEQELTFVCEPKSIIAQVDRDNLDKILVNLISNALKYTPNGGKIEVALSVGLDSDGKECYRITVTDTGIGLDNKMLNHLFDRFYRNRERHQTYTSGFGIGLDLCMRLVGLHNGTISGENRADGVKGSVFTVTLPLIKEAASVQAPRQAVEVAREAKNKEDRLPYLLSQPAAMPEESKPKRSSLKSNVMIVDDDTELSAYLEHNLSKGYHVKTYANAEDALKALAYKQPDIIITDVRMDGIDGFELLRRVKSNVATHHIPVILFSSANEADERTKGWKYGADGYVAKPFSIEEIDGMIKGLLSTRQKLRDKYSGVQEDHSQIEMPKVTNIKTDLMAKIDKYINDNLSESELNVDRLSECVGLSRSQIYRKMKEIAGISPSDYIRNVKLRKACELLRESDIDISQVAYSLGFSAQSHFSTLFKRFVGLTPTEYRQRALEGENLDDITNE